MPRDWRPLLDVEVEVSRLFEGVDYAAAERRMLEAIARDLELEPGLLAGHVHGGTVTGRIVSMGRSVRVNDGLNPEDLAAPAEVSGAFEARTFYPRERPWVCPGCGGRAEPHLVVGSGCGEGVEAVCPACWEWALGFEGWGPGAIGDGFAMSPLGEAAAGLEPDDALLVS